MPADAGEWPQGASFSSRAPARSGGGPRRGLWPDPAGLPCSDRAVLDVAAILEARHLPRLRCPLRGKKFPGCQWGRSLPRLRAAASPRTVSQLDGGASAPGRHRPPLARGLGSWAGAETPAQGGSAYLPLQASGQRSQGTLPRLPLPRLAGSLAGPQGQEPSAAPLAPPPFVQPATLALPPAGGEARRATHPPPRAPLSPAELGRAPSSPSRRSARFRHLARLFPATVGGSFPPRRKAAGRRVRQAQQCRRPPSPRPRSRRVSPGARRGRGEAVLLPSPPRTAMCSPLLVLLPQQPQP